MNRILLFILSVAIAVVIVTLRNRAREQPQVPASPPPAEEASPVVAPSPSPAPQVGAKRPREAALSGFLEKFGRNLEIKTDALGKVASVRGRAGSGNPAPSGFSPLEPQAAIARAKSVVDAAREILGIGPRSPLGNPVAKVGEVSAQVFFKQSFEGAELIPFGNVTVDLGPRGELVALESSYIPDPIAENSRTLSSSQALPGAAEGGLSVFWIPRAGQPTGRHAYEYFVEDHQVIVDAATGKTLLKRDRRKH